MKTMHRTVIALLAAFILLNGSLRAQSATVIVEKGTRLMLDVESPLNSSTAREGDVVLFRIRNDIKVLDRIAIPEGTLVQGTVTRIHPAFVNGRAQHAELQIQFQELVLSDGTRLELSAEALKLESAGIETFGGPRGVVRGPLSGMSVGAVLGGRRGAAIGTIASIGIGIFGALKSQRVKGVEVDLPHGAIVQTRLRQPLELPEPALPARSPAAAALLSPSASVIPGMSAAVGREPAATAPPGLSSLDTAPDPGRPTMAYPTSPEATAATSAAAFTLSVDVKVVQVDAVVRDRAGRPMKHLLKEDFRVLDEGLEQQIQSFSRDQLPLAVALVVDRSGSVAPLMNRIQTAAFKALQHLKPGDQVALFSFANDVELLEPLTGDRQRVANRISTIRSGGGTRIVDALDEALGYLEGAAPDRRRAVVVISDNLDGDSRTSVRSVVRLAHNAEAVIYGVRIRPDSAPFPPGLRVPSVPIPRTRPQPGSDPVTVLARETGGEVFDARTSALDAVLETAVTRLKLRYTLSYAPTAPSSPGSHHAIEVRLAERFGQAGSDYTVLARRGYYE